MIVSGAWSEGGAKYWVGIKYYRVKSSVPEITLYSNNDHNLSNLIWLFLRSGSQAPQFGPLNVKNVGLVVD